MAPRRVRQPRRPVVGRRAWQPPALRPPAIDARWRRVALPAAVLVLAMAGGWWLYHSALLSIRGVSVEGNVMLPEEVVREVAGLDGRSLIRTDFSAAEERLRSLPLVKDADIGRDWPLGASVRIVERQPWGVWRLGGQDYTIDGEGVVLNVAPPEGAAAIVQTDAAPPLRPGDRVDAGAVAVAAKLVASAEQALGAPVTALEFSQAAGLTAILGDLRVAFGDSQGYEFKLASLFAVLERAQEQGQALRRVDLRFGDRVAIQ
jgi:cell division protein FtsQ